MTVRPKQAKRLMAALSEAVLMDADEARQAVREALPVIEGVDAPPVWPAPWAEPGSDFRSIRERAGAQEHPPAKLMTTTERGMVVASVSTCVECHDTRYVPAGRDEFGYSMTKPCRCDALHRKASRIRQARLRRGALFVSLASYDPTAGGVNSDVAQARRQAHAACCEFVAGYKPESLQDGVFLFGPHGTGKTHLLSATIRELVTSGIRGLFIEWAEFVGRVKAAFGDDTVDLVEHAASVPVLAIDELGAGRCTDFERSMIEDIVVRRDSRQLPTLVATNCDPYDDADDSLKARIGERATTRLVNNAAVVCLFGPEYRALRRHHGK